jgi:sec-independent protein translocase protein TatA
MGSFSLLHWLIVLFIIMLLFGTRRLPGMMTDLAGAVRAFRKGLQDGEGEVASSQTPPAPQPAYSAPQRLADAKVVEAEVVEVPLEQVTAPKPAAKKPAAKKPVAPKATTTKTVAAKSPVKAAARKPKSKTG